MILVKTFYAFNELRNYSYLISDDQTGESWIVDPYEASPIIDYIKEKGLLLKGILNTHQHFDHIRGNAALMETFHASVQNLKDSESIQLSDSHSIETINSPGHTLDHQVFIWKRNKEPQALFSGDTIFNSGVGNCKGGGDVNLLYQTTKKLSEILPSKTILYPGHDYRKKNLEFAHKLEPENKAIKENLYRLKNTETHSLVPVTLGEEMEVNPFFRLSSEEIKEQVGMKTSHEKELFIKLRSLRDQW